MIRHYNDYLIFKMGIPVLLREYCYIMKTVFPRYGYSHVKDKMVTRLSYL